VNAPPAPEWAAEARSPAELAEPDELRDHEDLLFRLHRLLRPSSYLEIGVNQGHSLRWALDDSDVVGVDPALDLADPPPAPAGATLFAATSDDAFADPRLADAVGGHLDLAFVDGLHLVEQVLADVAGVAGLAHPGTVVLLHDTLPPEPAAADRERSTLLWTGDVWKAVVAVRQVRPALVVATLQVPPSGVTLVRGLDAVPNLDAQLELGLTRVDPLRWVEDAQGRQDQLLATRPGTWTEVLRLVADLV